MKKLDILEDHPDWYERKKVKVILENGEEIEAWLYFNEETEGRKVIYSGDFAENKIKIWLTISLLECKFPVNLVW